MRFLSLVFKKQRAMFGGVLPALVMLALLTLCSFAADGALRATRPDSIRVLVIDEDASPESKALTDALSAHAGLTVTASDSPAAARRALSLGRAEGLLLLSSGYGAGIRTGDTDGRLRYESAPLASSGQAVREIVSGAVARQRIHARAYRDAEAMLGELSPADRAALTTALSAPLPAAYTVRTAGRGAPAATRSVYAAFSARYQGFGALCAMLCLLTLSAFFGREESLAVNDRLRVLPHGGALAAGSDVCALLLTGLLTVLPAFLPMTAIRLRDVLSFAAYVFCVTGLCFLIGRFGRAAGRIDVLSPFVALFTGLLGGCFLDLSAVSPALRTLSLFTPQGLLLEAVSTDTLFAPLALLAVGGICLTLAFLPYGRRRAAR